MSPQKIEYTVLDMIETAVRNVKVTPLNLGGVSGDDGGSGGPPGGIIGQLSQKKVAYDSTESETLFTPASGMSLLDNLNHIRYRIGELESGGVSGSGVVVVDDNQDITYDPTTHIHFSGAGVQVFDLGDGEVQVVISGGSGGGGDDTYLRLDTANDPLTDTLELINDNPGNTGIYVQTTDDAYTGDFEQYAYNNNDVFSPVMFLYRSPGDSGTSVFNSYMLEAGADEGTGSILGGFIYYEFNGTEVFRVDNDGGVYSNQEILITEAPINGQAYGRQDGEWVTISGGSGGSGCAIIDDLTSQITESGIHFDLLSEPQCSSGIMLFYNGVFQPPTYFQLDEDNLGLTTDFVVYSGDSLYAVYGFEGFVVPGGGDGTDDNAIHDNVSGEISSIAEKATPVDGDIVVIEDSEASFAKKKVNVSNFLGGGGGWEQVINESGTSFSNFTSSAGTWSSDGSVIKQTDTSASAKRAIYNTKVVTSMLVFQADIQLKSTGSDRLGGLLVGYDGSGSGGMLVRINEGQDEAEVVPDAGSVLANLSVTINIDTWYTLRVVVAGGVASVYLDGTLLGSGGNNAQRSGDASYIGLYSYQSETWFRNIKAWNLQLPA